MTVNLSAFAGAGWQFFDDSGVPLAGGKIYTYAAGTTTPAVTYTSNTGITQNSNPIILDAAGRVSEEIWLPENTYYKFVVKNSNDVLIRSYDNIISIANGANIESNILALLANTSDITKGDALIGFKQADNAGFLTGAVARTVHQKLEEFVSVKDFGAVGDGVTNDYSAIQAAFDTGLPVIFPKAEYLSNSELTLANDNQPIFLQGSILTILNEVLTITGDDVVIDLQGGILSQGVGYATVAVETTPGASTITVVDASNLTVGQFVGSSWGDETNGEYPLGGIDPFNTYQNTVQSIAGNVVTLTKPLLGSVCTLPVGLTFGNFAFSVFIQPHGKRTIIQNGVIERANGFYAFVGATAPEFTSLTWQSIYFASNGADQFNVNRKSTMSFQNCYLEKNWDVAKQGIVWSGDARVYINNSYMELANHDNCFLFGGNVGLIQTGYSRLSVSDSTISGINKIPTAGIGPGQGSYASDCLYCIEATTTGTIERIDFNNVNVENIKVSFLAGGANNRTENIVIAEVKVNSCAISCNFMYYIFTGAGAGFNCPNANVSATSFYVQQPTAFQYVAAISGATVSVRPVFDGCYFKLDNAAAQFASPAIVRNSTFNATPLKYSQNILELQNSLFQNGSTISISPTFTEASYGEVESIAIDSPYFPTAAGSFFIALGASNILGAKLATAKSINGSTYYNVFKDTDQTVKVSGEFYNANGTYFLRGDDYYITKGSTVLDMANGTSERVTFNLLTTLASAAAAGATSIVVTSDTGIAVGDKINVVNDNGLVDTVTVDAAYISGTTVPLVSALVYASASGNAVNFFRLV
jgi:hypothetical protein